MDSITQYPYGREILICAFRYSCGRATCMPSIIVETIQNEWNNLTDADKRLFRREIKEAIDRNMAGHACDVVEWQKILDMED